MRFRYNILAAFQVFFSLAFFFLLASQFGASSKSDAFLVAQSFITAIQLMQLMFVEQFLYFYQEKKKNGIESVRQFYKTSVLMAFFVGCCFVTLLLLFKFFFLAYIAHYYDSDVFEYLNQVFFVLFLGLIIYPISYVNDRALNAEGYFSFAYISETLPFVFMVVSFYVCNYLDIDLTVSKLAAAKVLGALFGLILTSCALITLGHWKGGWLQLGTQMRELKFFIKNSFYMRFSHNINNVGLNIVTNAFLLTLPQGNASIYHYALRGVVIIKQVVVGPFYRVFQTKMGELVYSAEKADIVNLTTRFFRISVSIYVVCAFFCYFLIYPVLSYLNPKALSPDSYEKIVDNFFVIAFWHLFMVMELTGVTYFMANKLYKFFLLVNTFYLFVTVLLVNMCNLNLTEFILLNITLQAFSFFCFHVLFKRRVCW